MSSISLQLIKISYSSVLQSYFWAVMSALRSKITKPSGKVRDPKLISADVSIFSEDISDLSLWVILITSFFRRHEQDMFLAFLTSLAGPIKLRIFPIILERMGRFL